MAFSAGIALASAFVHMKKRRTDNNCEVILLGALFSPDLVPAAVTITALSRLSCHLSFPMECTALLGRHCSRRERWRGTMEMDLGLDTSAYLTHVNRRSSRAFHTKKRAEIACRTSFKIHSFHRLYASGTDYEPAWYYCPTTASSVRMLKEI